MKRFTERLTRFLDAPVGLAPRGLLVAAALLLALAWAAPLWSMTMFAPQYPEGLRLEIYSHKLVGGNGGQDVQEINVLNHYIGMKDLSQTAFPEFRWLPVGLAALALLLLRAAVHGRARDVLDALALFMIFAAVSAWSFGATMWDYGHDLAPGAPVRVDPFLPPLFGAAQLANFEVYSYPGAGAYALVAAGAAVAAALLLAARSRRRAAARFEGEDPGLAATGTAGR